ncbi:hypothetical protein GCM10028791_03160 [Echinicola sediminis]
MGFLGFIPQNLSHQIHLKLKVLSFQGNVVEGALNQLIISVKSESLEITMAFP